jgi:hypothetical protein
MNIKDIKGLKYPDEYFIKFFFKYQFHNKKDLTFIELGCSNGCNLMLPFQYNFTTLGVELNETLCEYANDNFNNLCENHNYTFHAQDMREFCHNSANIQADVLVLASSIYYIPQEDFILLLKDIRQNNLIKQNIPFYIRFREVDDFRNGKGKQIEANSYILQNGITGEDGLFCEFYKTEQMIDILIKELNLREFEVMSLQYENIQNNSKVNNSEVVIWGRIN